MNRDKTDPFGPVTWRAVVAVPSMGTDGAAMRDAPLSSVARPRGTGVEMRSARKWGKSLAAVAGAAALAGIVPGPVPAHTAFAADACGNNINDYAGTFVGTALQGDGPEKLTYTITFPTGLLTGFYTSQLTVSDTSGTYGTEGEYTIVTVQDLGYLLLTVPHWITENRAIFAEVTASKTQCLSGPLPGGGSASPPTVTSFVIRVIDGADIIMIRQT
ncbi:hypothetical protein [Streptomyces sp. NPDC047968]|uniref:hypothetical protein n=1 Tax=unclassified Streptomyces TaxID=2593676 RepID=UPI00342B9AB6